MACKVDWVKVCGCGGTMVGEGLENMLPLYFGKDDPAELYTGIFKCTKCGTHSYCDWVDVLAVGPLISQNREQHFSKLVAALDKGGVAEAGRIRLQLESEWRRREE